MTRRSLTHLAPVALLALACAYAYKLEKVDNWAWRSADVNRVQVQTQNGEIGLTAATDTLITAKVTRHCLGIDSADAEKAIQDITVTDSTGGGRLSLKAKMPDVNTRSYGVAFALSLPDTVHFDLNTNNGAVDIKGMVAGGSIVTSNGAITLTSTRGPITAATSNGAGTITDHRGDLTFGSSNGAITCGVIELPAAGVVALTTSDGAVTLYLPDSVSAHFDASTSNGDVSVSGFSHVTYSRSDNTHKTGTIGDGAATVTIVSSNGAVSIVAK